MFWTLGLSAAITLLALSPLVLPDGRRLDHLPAPLAGIETVGRIVTSEVAAPVLQRIAAGVGGGQAARPDRSPAEPAAPSSGDVAGVLTERPAPEPPARAPEPAPKGGAPSPDEGGKQKAERDKTAEPKRRGGGGEDKDDEEGDGSGPGTWKKDDEDEGGDDDDRDDDDRGDTWSNDSNRSRGHHSRNAESKDDRKARADHSKNADSKSNGDSRSGDQTKESGSRDTSGSGD